MDAKILLTCVDYKSEDFAKTLFEIYEGDVEKYLPKNEEQPYRLTFLNYVKKAVSKIIPNGKIATYIDNKIITRKHINHKLDLLNYAKDHGYNTIVDIHSGHYSATKEITDKDRLVNDPRFKFLISDSIGKDENTVRRNVDKIMDIRNEYLKDIEVEYRKIKLYTYTLVNGKATINFGSHNRFLKKNIKGLYRKFEKLVSQHGMNYYGLEFVVVYYHGTIFEQDAQEEAGCLMMNKTMEKIRNNKEPGRMMAKWKEIEEGI
jgi:hypothetical protein